MSIETFRRKLALLLNGSGNHSKRNISVPTKVSEMELAAYDAIAYDGEEDFNSPSSLQSDTGSVGEENMAHGIMENTIKLDREAYIAGDVITGAVTVTVSQTVEPMSMDLKLVGEGMALYFKSNFRVHRLCEIKAPTVYVKELHCTESGKTWKIPFTLQLRTDLYSSIDSGKKGRVSYFLTWELGMNVGDKMKKSEPITILAKQDLSTLPRRRNITGTNIDEEEFDNMILQLYTPVNAYLPGERVQFRAYAKNLLKKPLKKIAVLLIQNVLFYKSSCNEENKGRTRSYLMSVSEKSIQLKQDEDIEWTDEIQIPDPIAPSANGFHRTNYELVLVAITKGKKSNIRAVFDQARYHFDLERYQDDYFRDFLPHAHCDIYIGSHHGNKRSACMSSNQEPVRAMNEIWKSKTKVKSQQRLMPRSKSQDTMSRLTINPPK